MSEQPELPFPPPGDRGGSTYSAPLDYVRLNKQANDVWDVMRDMRWHTLADIAEHTRHPEASISARLRDFRKNKFGGHEVQRERITEGGLFRYRLVPNPDARIAAEEPARAVAK